MVLLHYCNIKYIFYTIKYRYSHLKRVNNLRHILITFGKIIPYVTYILLCYYIINEITINYSYIYNINDILYPLIKGGILQIKFLKGGIILYPVKLKSFGGWIHIYICILLYLCIIIPLLFIINNITVCLLYVLAWIFIKAIYMNFWDKHIGFILSKWKARNNNEGGISSLIYFYIKFICKQYKYLFLKFIQLWIISFTIVSFNRNIVRCFFENDNIISCLFIVILALPISLLLINILVKKLKKEKIILQDFYIFNDYIVERVNLYRISYLGFITVLYKEFYIYWINTLCIIIPIIVIIMFVFILNLILKNKGYKSSPRSRRSPRSYAGDQITYNLNSKPRAYGAQAINLESKPDPINVAVSTIVGLGGLYQSACNEGVSHYYEGNKGGRHWRKINFSKPGKYYVNGTVNITQRNLTDLYIPSTGYDSIIQKHIDCIEKSPILNMAYKQKNVSNQGYAPVTYFSNDAIYGSVAQVKAGHNFLVINILRKDWDACVFMPSYYLPEDTRRSSEVKVDQAIRFFETKYNIMVPLVEERFVGLIVFTQAESINTKGLFRHWRPLLDYVEPDFLVKVPNVKEYYELGSFDTKRIKGYNNEKIITALKYHTAASLCLTPLEDKIKNEIVADRWYMMMLDYFLLKGQICNRDKYFKIQEDKWYKKEKITNSQPLKKRELDKIEASIKVSKNNRKISGQKVVSFSDDPITKSNPRYRKNASLRLESLRLDIGKYYANNNSVDKRDNLVLSFRRDYHRDYSIWNHELDYSFYSRIDNTGLIEGFKDRGQRLGNWDENLYVPLYESRTNLWNTIYKKYTNGGVHSNNNVKNVYAICITRLSFEFFEFRTGSNIDLYVNDKSAKGTEAYSIIDVFNNNLICSLKTKTDNHNIMLPKHDYNFFNNKDENSIRKVMDFFYRSPDNDLVYKSDLKNEDFPDDGLDLKSVFPKISSTISKTEKLLQIHIDRLNEKAPIEPWGEVTQEEIDEYINKKQSIRKVGGLGGLNSEELLDKAILQATAKATIRNQKIYDYRLRTGLVTKKTPRNNYTASRVALLALVLKESQEESRQKIAEIKARLEAEKQAATVEQATATAEEEATATAEEEATVEIGAAIEANLTKSLELDKGKNKELNTNSDQVVSEKQDDQVVSEKQNDQVLCKPTTPDTFWGTDNMPETDELMNIYIEPNIDRVRAQSEEFSYSAMAGVEDENLFGSSMNIFAESTNMDFLSATGTDTIEDEDIYSAN